jgi:hypothetical protein
MLRRLSRLPIALFLAIIPALRAAAPPLLAQAILRWTAVRDELAFTQQTTSYHSDGSVREIRVERYDPSLPDSSRWRLLELNGIPATQEEQTNLESKKNGRPKRKVHGSPSEFLDLEHATVVNETQGDVRYRIALRPVAEHLISLDGVDVVITIDKRTGNIAGIGAALREPVRVLMGLAQVTDIDVDLRINPSDEGPRDSSEEIESSSTARVKVSKLGRPVEFNWSAFKRVPAFDGS